MNLDEAISLIEANAHLKQRLQKATENLNVFGSIDEARELALVNTQRRLALLKENLLVWATLMEAAAGASDPGIREAYDLLLEFHAGQMKKFADKI